MLWVSDFTYVATWTGFLYVGLVIAPYNAASSAVAYRGPRL